MAKRVTGLKKKKINQLDFVKGLTRWLTTPTRNPETLSYLIKKYDMNTSKLFLRIASYCYNNPKIIWYFNKYFNNKYGFYSFEEVNLVRNMAFVMDVNMHNNSKSFFFLKSTEERDNNKQKVKGVISEYFNAIHNYFLNDLELNFYYDLFIMGQISEDELIEMDKLVNGGTSNLKLEELEISSDDIQVSKQDIDSYFDQSKLRALSEPVATFVDQMKQYKLGRAECQGCPLFNNAAVVLDTNADNFGEVDIAFIGLSPNIEDATYGKTGLGETGRILREKMYFLHPDTKWIILNTTMCATRDRKEIGKNAKEVNAVLKNCSHMCLGILKQFPAKYYVPMGKAVSEMFGVKGSITSNSGEMFETNNKTVIPLVDPAALIKQKGNNAKAFSHGFRVLTELMNNKYMNNQHTQQQPNHTQQIQQKTQQINNLVDNIQSFSTKKVEHNIPNDKLITQPTDDMTLFDVVNLDSRYIVHIFIDSNGEKKYLIDDYKLPVFIKNKSWKECTMLTDEVDMVSYINGFDRYKLMTAARDSMKVAKQGALTGDV